MKSLANLNQYLGLVDPEKPKPLAKLGPLDKQMLLLYLQGEDPKEICEQLSCSISRFRRVIKSEIAQLVIEDYFQFCDQEFSTLYELSIQAIRDALKADSLETRLRAADKFLKAHGKYDSGGPKEMTAEDVVRRIFELRVTEERPANQIPSTQKQLTAQNLNTQEIENASSE